MTYNTENMLIFLRNHVTCRYRKQYLLLWKNIKREKLLLLWQNTFGNAYQRKISNFAFYKTDRKWTGKPSFHPCIKSFIKCRNVAGKFPLHTGRNNHALISRHYYCRCGECCDDEIVAVTCKVNRSVERSNLDIINRYSDNTFRCQ